MGNPKNKRGLPCASGSDQLFSRGHEERENSNLDLGKGL